MNLHGVLSRRQTDRQTVGLIDSHATYVHVHALRGTLLILMFISHMSSDFPASQIHQSQILMNSNALLTILPHGVPS